MHCYYQIFALNFWRFAFLRLRQKSLWDSYFNQRIKYFKFFLRLNFFTTIFSISKNLTIFEINFSFIDTKNDEIRFFLYKSKFDDDENSNCAIKLLIKFLFLKNVQFVRQMVYFFKDFKWFYIFLWEFAIKNNDKKYFIFFV